MSRSSLSESWRETYLTCCCSFPRPEFARLHATIEVFRNSLPAIYSAPEAITQLDSRFALVVALTHVALIVLHEPFVTSQAGDPSMSVCGQAARAIFASILQLWTTSYDIAQTKQVPYMAYCWAVTGRELSSQRTTLLSNSRS